MKSWETEVVEPAMQLTGDVITLAVLSLLIPGHGVIFSCNIYHDIPNFRREVSPWTHIFSSDICHVYVSRA